MNSSLKLGSGSTSTRQNYAGKHPYLQNHMPTQGPGGGLLSQNQRTAIPQVSWVSSGQGVTDLPFPKRVGVEFNGIDSPQSAKRQISLQTTSAGQSQTRQYPDNVVRPSIAPVSYLMNPQGPRFSHGQSQMVELPNNPRGQAPTTSVDGLSNNSEYYARPYHKRSAVAPPSGAHWVQRQKMSHPTTTHHSMPIRFPTKPAASVIANLAHPSIPIYQSQSQTQQPVRALMNPSIPYTWIFCLVVLELSLVLLFYFFIRLKKEKNMQSLLTFYESVALRKEFADATDRVTSHTKHISYVPMYLSIYSPNGSPGVGFMPHILDVKAGEDVLGKLMWFSQNSTRVVCILSANGAISNVTLQQSATSGGTVTYEILSLCGSFMVCESDGQRSRTGGLSVSLSGPNGRVLGGNVAGLLTAASPVQMIVGSFVPASQKQRKIEAKIVNTTPVNVGTTSGSSGGGIGSPLVHSNNSNPQGMANMPWRSGLDLFSIVTSFANP
ncbi:unnamed protein product [Lactuca saligna]|uniref:AT-hook motif nuclear-localized protein n=1 Tax=Lactuca saligna TaxID=75948 RepID=A0AA35YUB1_LACSI|nr:unnamed protein product [Lactuca saligna]